MDHTPKKTQDCPTKLSPKTTLFKKYPCERPNPHPLAIAMDQVWKSREAASLSHLSTSDLCLRMFSVVGTTHDTVLMLC